MKKLMVIAAVIAAAACPAVAGEKAADVRLRIPFADSGSQIVGDVEAVLAAHQLSDAQVAAIDNAKLDYTAAREKLLADFSAKFTEAVGAPDEVFATVDDPASPKNDRILLKAKIDKFASSEGAGFRSSIVMLEGGLKREISRSLGRDEAVFKSELARRLGLKATPLGAYIVKVQDSVPRLKLSDDEQRKFANLLDGLKLKQEKLMKDYTDKFTQMVGTADEMAKIRKSGKLEDVAELDKRIADVRTALTADLQQNSERAMKEFEASIGQLLNAEQVDAFRKATKPGP